MELELLYDFAVLQNIGVRRFALEKAASISYMDEDGDCYIAMDPHKIKTTADEKYKLAHDLGHCMRGAFYNRYSKLDIIGRHERRATVWAIKKLLPREELITAIKGGHGEFYDLAEYFDLPEELVREACAYYQLVS